MTAEPRVQGASQAVLVGVSAYQHPQLPPIRAALNNLQAMHALLSDPALCGWLPAQIATIPDPRSATSLADKITDLTENVTEVFLMYYVGHGVLTDRGDLSLTVETTRPDRAKISGLAWETVADILRNCPARVRVVILDCCFAGRAIETLSADGSASGLADIAHVSGVYTLAATTRNRTAHVPPPNRQETACTFFTGELRDLVRGGIPDGPPWLTFADIYPVLRYRLKAKGLPEPSQCGTDTALLFPFTANAAPVLEEESSLQVQHPIVRKPRRISRVQPTRVLEDAERLAQSINNKESRAKALVAVAKVLAVPDPDRAAQVAADALNDALRASQTRDEVLEVVARFDPDLAESLVLPGPFGVESERLWSLVPLAVAMAAIHPERAERLAQSIPHDHFAYIRALEGITEVLAISHPDQAERLARAMPDGWSKAETLEKLAVTLAALDPQRATGIARSIGKTNLQASALAKVARTVTESNPDLARQLIKWSESAATSMKDKWWTSRQQKERKASVLAVIAAALANLDPARKARFITDAERIARSIIGKSRRAMTLVAVAESLAGSDPAESARIITDAARIAQSVRRWRIMSRDAALATVAEVAAASDPELAESLAQSIYNTRDMSGSLGRIAKVLASSDSYRAERIAQLIGWAGLRGDTLGDIAEIIASHSPERAERIARSITDNQIHDLTHERDLALKRVAAAMASVDPDRAERIARSITRGEIEVEALAAIAKVLLQASASIHRPIASADCGDQDSGSRE